MSPDLPPNSRSNPSVSWLASRIIVSLAISNVPEMVSCSPGFTIASDKREVVVELGPAAPSVALVRGRGQGEVLDAGEQPGIARSGEVDRVIAPKEHAVIARAAVDDVAGGEALLGVEEDVVAEAAGERVPALAAVDDVLRVGLRRAVEGEILALEQGRAVDPRLHPGREVRVVGGQHIVVAVGARLAEIGVVAAEDRDVLDLG